MSNLQEVGPKITVTGRVAYKVNTGNFENMDVEASFTTDVFGGKDEAVKKYNQLHETALSLVEQKVQEIRSVFSPNKE